MEIAGINFSVKSKELALTDEYVSAYESFLTKTPMKQGALDIRVTLEPGNMPDTRGLSRIYDGGRSWSMFIDGNDYILTLHNRYSEEEPYWLSRFNADVKDVNVYCGRRLIQESNGETLVTNPVHYPLDQILLMYILARSEGALFHSAGVSINGRGYIFPGISGAGKSTITRLFAEGEDTELLSDDRMIVRKIDDAFMAFGTPWPGDAGIAQNLGMPLAGIFFIYHGADNRIKAIEPKEAVKRLLPVMSIPWYDRNLLPEILGFCEDLICTIPAYELQFQPGKEVIDVFKKFVAA
jgi:hypothetical protein